MVLGLLKTRYISILIVENRPVLVKRGMFLRPCLRPIVCGKTPPAIDPSTKWSSTVTDRGSGVGNGWCDQSID